MKILLCHNYYKERGGEDTVFDYEKELLKQKGYEVIEYCKRSKGINNVYKNLGVLVSSFFSINTYREINRIIKEKKPDIAHLHNIFPIISPSIYYVLKKNNIPIVQTIHNYRFYCSNGLSIKSGRICSKCEKLSFKSIFNICNKDKKLYDLLLSLIIYFMRKFKVYDKVNYFIAPSKFIQNMLVRFGINENKIIFKVNLINTNIDLISLKECKNVKNLKYFSYVGRLAEEKGIIELVKVFKEIRNIGLRILGTGPLEGKIESFIIKNKLKNIELLGFITGHKKEEIIQGGIATIVPSICYENCPIIIIECLNLGVPLIVNNVGALPEYIRNGYNGYIYDFNDFIDLKKKVLKLYNMGDNQLEKLRRNCKKSFFSLFDESRNFKIIDGLYKSIIKSKAMV